MLVLSRKVGEKLLIGDDIAVSVVRVDGQRVRIGIDAPPGVAIARGEVARPRTGHVLIVDDNPADRLLYRGLLAENLRAKLRYTEAECGGEGLELLNQLKPDCVLLDYRLPDLDGCEFLDQLDRSASQLPIPIYMLTRFGGEHVARAALEKGASGFFLKGDLSGKVLSEAVEDALRKMARWN